MTAHQGIEAQLREPAHHVSERARTFWTVRASVPWLVLIIIETVVLIVVAGKDNSRVAVTIIGIVLAVTGMIALAHLIVMPRWRYRVHLWEITDTAMYAQSGWITQERRIAPLSRVQTVDVERGPLEQLFKLASVTITTASAAGPITIKGLDSHVADDVVARLTIVTAASEGDAT